LGKFSTIGTWFTVIIPVSMIAWRIGGELKSARRGLETFSPSHDTELTAIIAGLYGMVSAYVTL
jgi:hypothetical protein